MTDDDIFCPECGERTPRTGVVCGHCGARVEHRVSTQPQRERELVAAADRYLDRAFWVLPYAFWALACGWRLRHHDRRAALRIIGNSLGAIAIWLMGVGSVILLADAGVI